MNKTIELLLERMESHPEEFYVRSRRWNWVTSSEFMKLVDKEDREALDEAYRKVRLAEFHDRVLQTILDPEYMEGEFAYAGTLGTVAGGFNLIESSSMGVVNKVAR